MTTLRRDCIALTIAAARNGRCGCGSCGVVLARCYVARIYGVGSQCRCPRRGEDARAVDAHAPRPGAFDLRGNHLGQDEADAEGLTHALPPLCERLSARLKQASRTTMPAAHDASHLMTLPRREG